ncbi:MAG: EFR1 family ferrodoxin [Methanomassiliicoccaceae archaeon]|nr:EFR1 family ferrodoxin [Methanomassiliicoccaceae archaeon]
MIFYFSGTGNSRYVAERLAALLDQQTVSISDVMRDGRTDDDRTITDDIVGIVAPVYFFGPPTIVMDFVSEMSFNASKAFTVLTHGGVSANASAMLRKKLTKKGVNVSHSFEIRLPDNYVPRYRVPDAAVQERLFAVADADIDKIPELLEKKVHLKKGSFPGMVMSAAAYPIYKRGRDTKGFIVTRRCNGCGKCASMCPVGMISVVDDISRWEPGKCVMCLACVNRCPQAAIERGKSRKHGRYVNPNVTFDD